jgi:hypothetical protein
VRLSGEAATEYRVPWLANDSVRWSWETRGLIPCFEKGWLEMHEMWTCEKVVVEFEFEEKSGFLGKEAREVRLTFQCT